MTEVDRQIIINWHTKIKCGTIEANNTIYSIANKDHLLRKLSEIVGE